MPRSELLMTQVGPPDWATTTLRAGMTRFPSTGRRMGKDPGGGTRAVHSRIAHAPIEAPICRAGFSLPSAGNWQAEACPTITYVRHPSKNRSSCLDCDEASRPFPRRSVGQELLE